ncbi:hypothetical protein PM082_011758 [Marasmius tenuissimus]|nr:hypothetical protein PM082_011758 [Marasmius tenuissimus]
MGYVLPFDPCTRSDVKRYASHMRLQRELAIESPLLPGYTTFTVKLAAPELPDNDPDHPRRELPPQQVLEETAWVLESALQYGPGYTSQVWRARPQNTAIVYTLAFKFVIPSQLEIPDLDTAAQR